MNMQRNLTAACAAYAAFANGDRQPFIDLIGSDCTISYYGDPERISWAGTFIGPEGFAEMLGNIGAHLQIGEYRATEFLPSGESLVVLGVGRGIARANGQRFEAHWAHFIRYNGDQAVEFRIYNDTLALAGAMSGGFRAAT